MTPEDITRELAISDAKIRLADNGHFYWLNVTREGISWSHRLPLDPQPHHIEAAKSAAEIWWKEEQE